MKTKGTLVVLYNDGRVEKFDFGSENCEAFLTVLGIQVDNRTFINAKLRDGRAFSVSTVGVVCVYFIPDPSIETLTIQHIGLLELKYEKGSTATIPLTQEQYDEVASLFEGEQDDPHFFGKRDAFGNPFYIDCSSSAVCSHNFQIVS